MASSTFLQPDPAVWSYLPAVLFLGVLTLWPLIESAGRGRWGWFWATVCLGPLAGVGWLLVGRREQTL